MSKINVILVDDFEIVRAGTTAVLSKDANINIIGEASGADELFVLLKTKTPDIILLDIMMPGRNGVEITQILTKEYPKIKIIIFSGLTEDESFYLAIKSGAHGLIPKTALNNELITAINKVYEGEDYMSKSIPIAKLMSFIKKSQIEVEKEKKEISLTDRQLEIIKLISESKSYKEIGNILSISERTVETHKIRILQKLELNSVIELVKFAIKNSIIEI